MPTSIEWTDETWNPVTGCVKVSPGCKNCYAETFAERFRGTIMPSGREHPFFDGFDPRLRPERLDQPFSWHSPRRVFVNSMSDLFGDFVPDSFLGSVFDVMRRTPEHTYQILTRRSERLRDWTQGNPWLQDAPHIWLGVSVEDMKYGVPRIADLRQAIAAVRFLSIEPLLEELGSLDLSRMDWVIVGGESGHHARPMQGEWVRDLRDQCQRQQVAFFFKQWGGKRKHLTGRELDGRTWDEFPDQPREVTLGRLQIRRPHPRQRELHDRLPRASTPTQLEFRLVTASHRVVAQKTAIVGPSTPEGRSVDLTVGPAARPNEELFLEVHTEQGASARLPTSMEVAFAG